MLDMAVAAGEVDVLEVEDDCEPVDSWFLGVRVDLVLARAPNFGAAGREVAEVPLNVSLRAVEVVSFLGVGEEQAGKEGCC